MHALRVLAFLAAVAKLGLGVFTILGGYFKGFTAMESSLPRTSINWRQDISIVAILLGASLFFGGLLSLAGFSISLKGFRCADLYLLSCSILGLSGIPINVIFALTPATLFVGTVILLVVGKPSRREYVAPMEDEAPVSRRRFPWIKR